MTLSVQCACGHVAEVSEWAAGLPVKCLECGALLTVDRPKAVSRFAADAIPLRPVSLVQPLPHVDLPSSVEPLEYAGDAASHRAAGLGALFSWRSNLGRGLGLMALAVLWFFGGLWFGILLPYPPFLFLAGLVLFLWGLTQRA